jgi:maltooligosyltrehalose trehalohydrolase
VIREVHVGMAGGYASMIAELAALAAIGFTAIELMPLASFGGTRNWGYDGVLPYAPATAYGTPDELKTLIDAAHSVGLMVLLDVVYNHFGPDGNYLSLYAPDFFRADAHTPWGGAIDFAQDAVARFFIDNALMWLCEFRFDGLRLDAVHAIADPSFLCRLAGEIRAATSGRAIHLVLENEQNEAVLLESAYDAQWNDDFHNVLHVLLTGESHGYYKDFAEDPAQKLARCLAEGFIYQGQTSPNQNGKPRGSASGHLPPARFVTFLQNHDQIGNRALGERLPLLTTPKKLRAATGLLLLCPQIPLCFMGDETGSRSPFLFFTDFHDALADAVREGRRGEFSDFPAFADPDARELIPDPNAKETFDRSRALPGPQAEEWKALYKRLLSLRRAHVIPHLDDACALGADVIGDKAVIARWQLGASTLTLALNLGNDAVSFALPEGTIIETLGMESPTDCLASAAFCAWIAA